MRSEFVIRLLPRIFISFVWNVLVIREKLHPLYSGMAGGTTKHLLVDRQIKRTLFASNFEFWVILQPVIWDKLHPFPGLNTPIEAFQSCRVPLFRMDPSNINSASAWFCILSPLLVFKKDLNHMKIAGNLHWYLCVREAGVKEEVDLKEKDLFYQILRAAFTVVIDNSEMGEF